MDRAGKALYDDWRARASAEDQRVVERLLDDVRWQRAWKSEWGASPDLFGRHDWRIRLRSDLFVVIREFSNEADPQGEFGFWIGPPPNDD